MDLNAFNSLFTDQVIEPEESGKGRRMMQIMQRWYLGGTLIRHPNFLAAILRRILGVFVIRPATIHSGHQGLRPMRRSPVHCLVPIWSGANTPYCSSGHRVNQNVCENRRYHYARLARAKRHI
jgi:hypothetical protein